MLHKVMENNRESWSLDDQIEQIDRMAKVWKRHAETHPAGTYGELVQEMAAGYQVQLQDLRAARAESNTAFDQLFTTLAA